MEELEEKLDPEKAVKDIAQGMKYLLLTLYVGIVTSCWWIAVFFGCNGMEQNFWWAFWIFAPVSTLPIIFFLCIFIGDCLGWDLSLPEEPTNADGSSIHG